MRSVLQSAVFNFYLQIEDHKILSIYFKFSKIITNNNVNQMITYNCKVKSSREKKPIISVGAHLYSIVLRRIITYGGECEPFTQTLRACH